MGLPLIHDDNGIRWITLDRPEIRNALRIEDLDHIAVKTFADATPVSARMSICAGA